ncbi:MAG: helix-turn-helix domain-containing protein [Treponema sp.]|nr:helix-turn-helix domain-containing protein [Treponema sp.]
MSSFSDRLKELRKSKKITQKQIAVGIGVSERNYQSFEYGEFSPNQNNLIKIADYFDVSADYLLGRSDNPVRQ